MATVYKKKCSIFSLLMIKVNSMFRYLEEEMILSCSPLKRQSHKMVKHTQAIRWQQPTKCLSVFDHFVKLALKGLN